MKNVILLGYGVVGSGVYDLSVKKRAPLKKNFNLELNIKKILVRDKSKYKSLDHYELFTDDFNSINLDDVDFVIEAIGNINPALAYIKKSLESRCHVITSNKDLIAEHGSTLHKIAFNKGVRLSYEASVGAGIPIINSLDSILKLDSIQSITGIINGTTNYILSQMYDNNLSYEDSLTAAELNGFAESDPSSDILGYDAARKMSILNSLSYNILDYWKDMHIEGIQNINGIDIQIGKCINTKLKLIGYSSIVEDNLYSTVRPCYIPTSDPISHINNEYNGISLNNKDIGKIMLQGKGAGKYPTASAIITDLINICKQPIRKQPLKFNKVETKKGLWPFNSQWVLIIKTTNDKAIQSSDGLDVLKSYDFSINHYNGYDYLVINNITENKMVILKEKLLEKLDINYINYYLILSGDQNDND